VSASQLHVFPYDMLVVLPSVPAPPPSCPGLCEVNQADKRLRFSLLIFLKYNTAIRESGRGLLPH
jgi:hypothetical protein